MLSQYKDSVDEVNVAFINSATHGVIQIDNFSEFNVDEALQSDALSKRPRVGCNCLNVNCGQITLICRFHSLH